MAWLIYLKYWNQLKLWVPVVDVRLLYERNLIAPLFNKKIVFILFSFLFLFFDLNFFNLLKYIQNQELHP